MKLTYSKDAPNYGVVELIRKPLQAFFDEVTILLPELPNELNIWLDNSFLVSDTGEGGAAYSPDTITVSFDKDFQDKSSQLKNLRGTVFHEAYHLVQGHTIVDGKAAYRSMLDSAIYEGCATVFERDYAGVVPLWGEYKQHSIQELMSWQDAMSAIPTEDYESEDSNLWNMWAYYDKEDGQRWKAYKTGSWLADKAIKTSNIDILKLRSDSAENIINLIKI